MNSCSPGGGEKSEWGKLAEEIARDYLVKEGYVVRERNWSPQSSKLEVDIIAEIPGTIVFVEVKARGAGGEDAAGAVNLTKQRRISKAADRYLRGLDQPYEYRFDIIAITGNKHHYTLEHLQDAYLPPLGY